MRRTVARQPSERERGRNGGDEEGVARHLYFSISHIEKFDATSKSSTPRRKVRCHVEKFDATSNSSTPRRKFRCTKSKSLTSRDTGRRFDSRAPSPPPTLKVSSPWLKSGFSGPRGDVEPQTTEAEDHEGPTTWASHLSLSAEQILQDQVAVPFVGGEDVDLDHPGPRSLRRNSNLV